LHIGIVGCMFSKRANVNAQGERKRPQREPSIPRTVAFYSFKGGVGRTTALTHVAWILAKRGRKVVAVDLDLEAPGLSSAINLSSQPPYGIVDYFYERSYLPEDAEPSISITEIFGEVRIPDASGRLFVVPAGCLDLDYIAKVDDLRSTVITERGANLWSVFFEEIKEQLQPDIILIDSRTGINEWGAFSLLRAADQAIVFLYPNEQNRHGIELLLKALAGQISIQLVFSPVPFGEAGMEKAKEYWLSLQNKIDAEEISHAPDTDEDIPSDIEVEATQSETVEEPLTIQYLTELALATSYPVQTLLSHYMNIANVVDEDTTVISLTTILNDTDHRRKIIEDLEFPPVDATTNQNLSNIFQRTADFEQFLNDTTCLIRGRKGTGKSALYWLLLKHEKAAKELSNRRLDSVTCLSGHGRFRGRPTREEFQLIDQSIEQKKGSWEAFWRSYLLLRIHIEGHLQQLLRGNKDSKFNQLRSILNRIPKDVELWQSEHTYMLINIATNVQLSLLAKDLLDIINVQLRKNGQVFWFLYDDLDEDLLEVGDMRKKALVGLFQFVQACDARRLKSIGFKIFLREDIRSDAVQKCVKNTLSLNLFLITLWDLMR
jgi:cellulose biosynthesis protein BcsQ